MNKELLQERKKMIYDFICDELYVPMKAKEMAIVLNVPKSQRGELLEVLDALTADGKVETTPQIAEMRVRGNTSALWEKKPYQIKFEDADRILYKMDKEYNKDLKLKGY